MLTDLPTLLLYKNTYVLNRYAIDHPNNQLGSEEAFEELLKFIWLSQKHTSDKAQHPEEKELNFICGIHAEMKEIDDMWHTFLLFTKDYMCFCQQYFGKYFHHLPTTEDIRPKQDDFALDFTRYLSYVYDNLGEKTLVKWFGSLID
jgi:hypothetical protein